MILYGNSLNANEWVVIVGFCFGYLLVLWLPRRFSIKKKIAYVLTGAGFGFFFDHQLGVIPVDFYDINDTSNFEIIDTVSYWMYGPVSYLFFYIYDWLRIKRSFSALYILAWALASVGFEYIAACVGVFHYKHGYSIAYSFPIYLGVQSIWVLLYYAIKNSDDFRPSPKANN